MSTPSTQQQTSQHTQRQLEHALHQHAQALGFPAINWGALVPLIMQLIQVLTAGGGTPPVAQQSQAGQPKQSP